MGSKVFNETPLDKGTDPVGDQQLEAACVHRLCLICLTLVP